MIDTATLSLPPRPGEQILGRPYPQLLATQAARLIEPGELEPYRALLTEYIAEFEDGEGVTADLAIERPGHWNLTVPRFFHWLATTHPDRLTVPQGNTEGDPMTLTTDEIAALEAATDGVAETNALRDGRLEPYRELLTEFNLTRCEGSEDATARSTESMIAQPSSWFVTLPQFFRWMRDNHKVHPGHETSEPEVTTFHVGDRVSYVEHPQNVMLVGDVRVVRAVHDGEVELNHADGPLAGQYANGHVSFDRLALVSCPHTTVEAEPGQQPESGLTAPGGNTFHLGDRVRLVMFDGPKEATVTDSGAHDPDPMGYPVVWTDLLGTPTWVQADTVALVSCPHAESTGTTVPQGNGNDGAEWGPSHPEWDGWWERARALAERFGYGSQYDALAEQLGGPERKRYDMVTVTITFPIEQDQVITHDAIRAGIEEHGFAVTDRHPR